MYEDSCISGMDGSCKPCRENFIQWNIKTKMPKVRGTAYNVWPQLESASAVWDLHTKIGISIHANLDPNYTGLVTTVQVLYSAGEEKSPYLGTCFSQLL